MLWHIQSFENKIDIMADSIEEAFVAALSSYKSFPLEKCGTFICGYEDGTRFEDGTTSWGLTEWYLIKAGYKKDEKGYYLK